MSAVRILRQQIPLARSILWAPKSAPRPSDTVFPVFLRQAALQAIYEHMATLPPPGQGILGFMLGDRCECPVSGVVYSVIDAALRLNQTIYSDRSLDVVTRLWKRLKGQIETQQAHLIGWYHTHAPLPLEMSAHDVETHQQYFGEPWQVGMIVGTDPDTPAGAFFRAGSDAAWVRTPQPFYELLNEDSFRPGGKKRSFMTWKTYRAYNPPALQALPGVGARGVAPSPPESTRAEPPPRRSAPHVPPPEAEPPPPPAPRKSAPYERPPEPEESVPDLSEREDLSGLENMPQAELDEPGRVDLSEPPASASPAPTHDRTEDEWEDPGALKFLSAADDNPPPLPTRPAAFPSPPPAPPSPAPVVDEPAEPVPEALAEDAPLEDEVAQETVPEAPAPRAARRRRSPGSGRRLARLLGRGLVVLLVAAGGVAAWRFGPSVWQRVSAFIPHGAAAPAAVAPRPAVPHPAAPGPAAPQPVAPRPTRVPRPEFALLDQSGDSLALALQAYNGRTRLFEKRVLDCLSLGRGMVRVERAAASYGLQRNATRAPLDPAHVDWDRGLTAGIDSASRGFQRSQCTHP